MKKDDKPIIVEEIFNNNISDVWRALTKPEQMRKWFFENMPDFKTIVGFKVEFDVQSGERIFPHQWEVTRVDPEKQLEVNWKYGGYDGSSFVRFELREKDGLTGLTVSCTIIEDFQDDIPEFTWESCMGGWRYFINERLKEYLKASEA